MRDGLEPPFDDGADRPIPPSPGDRAWRHPSELRGGAPTAEPTRTRRAGRASLVVASCLGLGLVMLGTLALAGVLANDPEPDVVQSRSVRDLVYMSSSTTAEPGRSGWLGISAVDEEGRDGVTVTECDAGSPAATELRKGDLIVAVDDTPTPRMAELITVLAASAPGHTARIQVERDGRSLLIPVVLGRQP
jgi:S1-C subfamily serine protease